MSLIDQALKANEQFARRYDPKLGGHPQPKIAIVTCMDPRLSDLEGILGLKTADMDVIRTGGPAVTDDVLGELVVSTRVLGSKEIMLLNHTGCGFTTFTDKELNDKLARETGDATPVPMRLFSFKDPEENTRAQIEKVRSHPWIAKDVPVRGFIFDVDTGRLREVKQWMTGAASPLEISRRPVTWVVRSASPKRMTSTPATVTRLLLRAEVCLPTIEDSGINSAPVPRRTMGDARVHDRRSRVAMTEDFVSLGARRRAGPVIITCVSCQSLLWAQSQSRQGGNQLANVGLRAV